jgi:hypothetical protein
LPSASSVATPLAAPSKSFVTALIKAAMSAKVVFLVRNLTNSVSTTGTKSVGARFAFDSSCEIFFLAMSASLKGKNNFTRPPAAGCGTIGRAGRKQVQ